MYAMDTWVKEAARARKKLERSRDREWAESGGKGKRPRLPAGRKYKPGAGCSRSEKLRAQWRTASALYRRKQRCPRRRAAARAGPPPTKIPRESGSRPAFLLRNIRGSQKIRGAYAVCLPPPAITALKLACSVATSLPAAVRPSKANNARLRHAPEIATLLRREMPDVRLPLFVGCCLDTGAEMWAHGLAEWAAEDMRCGRTVLLRWRTTTMKVEVCDVLIYSLAGQPRGYVHRDPPHCFLPGSKLVLGVAADARRYGERAGTRFFVATSASMCCGNKNVRVASGRRDLVQFVAMGDGNYVLHDARTLHCARERRRGCRGGQATNLFVVFTAK